MGKTLYQIYNNFFQCRKIRSLNGFLNFRDTSFAGCLVPLVRLECLGQHFGGLDVGAVAAFFGDDAEHGDGDAS
ncbi:hypothetical protein BH11ARM2_BH11ARM2_05910 [soil metagenome]